MVARRRAGLYDLLAAQGSKTSPRPRKLPQRNPDFESVTERAFHAAGCLDGFIFAICGAVNGSLTACAIPDRNELIARGKMISVRAGFCVRRKLLVPFWRCRWSTARAVAGDCARKAPAPGRRYWCRRGTMAWYLTAGAESLREDPAVVFGCSASWRGSCRASLTILTVFRHDPGA